jgi:hypothetical protein
MGHLGGTYPSVRRITSELSFMLGTPKKTGKAIRIASPVEFRSS